MQPSFKPQVAAEMYVCTMYHGIYQFIFSITRDLPDIYAQAQGPQA